MNVFSKVTLEALKKNRTRTIVTVIGVILSVSLFTAATSLVSSMQKFMLDTVKAETGDWHGAFFDADSVFIENLRKDDRVKSVGVIQNVGVSVLEGCKNPLKPYLNVVGFDDGAYNMRPPIKLKEGRFPKNSSEITVSEDVITEGGIDYKIGDMLELEIGLRIDGKNGYNISLDYCAPYHGTDENSEMWEKFVTRETKTYTVVGICERPPFEQPWTAEYTALTGVEYGDNNTVYNAYFKMKKLSQTFGFIDEKQSQMVVFDDNWSDRLAAFNDENGQRLDKSSDNMCYQGYENQEYLYYNGVIRDPMEKNIFAGLGGVVGLIIMGASLLLIYNSFSISVRERTRQFGILSSVGATRKQLRRSVLFEGLCVGLIGVPLGVLLGISGMGIAVNYSGEILDRFIQSEIKLHLHVAVWAVTVAVILSAVTILISAAIPAFRGTRGSAIERIRMNADIKFSRKAVKTSKLFEKLFGVQMLARKNFKRSKKSYRAAVFSLIVSIVLFNTAGAFTMYLKAGIDETMYLPDYDLSFTYISNAYYDSNRKEDNETTLDFYDKLKDVTGVYKSGYNKCTVLELKCNAEDLNAEYVKKVSQFRSQSDEYNTYTSLYFIDDGNYIEYLKENGLNPKDYMGENVKLTAYTVLHGRDADTKRYTKTDVFKSNDDITATAYKQPVYRTELADGEQQEKIPVDITFTQVKNLPDLYKDDMYTGIVMFAPFSAYEQFSDYRWTNPYVELIFKSDNLPASGKEMHKIMADAGVGEDNYSLYNAYDSVNEDRTLMTIVNIFAYGFTGLLSLIAVANVFNTVSTSIGLRRRELAMLGSIGMTDKSLYKMMSFECLFYGFKSLFFALPLSGLITYAIYTVILSGVDLPFMLPWGSIWISIGGVFVSVFATMLYSVSKVKKQNTVETLRENY